MGKVLFKNDYTASNVEVFAGYVLWKMLGKKQAIPFAQKYVVPRARYAD